MKAQKLDPTADTPLGYPIVRLGGGLYDFKLIPQNGFCTCNVVRCQDDREAYETAKRIDRFSRYYFLDKLPSPVTDDEQV